MTIKVRLVLTVAAIALVGGPRLNSGGGDLSAQGARNLFEDWLVSDLEQFHTRYDVWDGPSSAGNHFAVRACLNEAVCKSGSMPPMQEDVACPDGEGQCLLASARLRRRDWSGWYFATGVFSAAPVDPKGRGAEPAMNWGCVPDAGIDLSGATQLTVMARGKTGGERVEFFAFGVGRDADTGQPLKPSTCTPPGIYPDSSMRATAGYVTLTREFQPIVISVKGRDLKYVLGGFGWVTRADLNGGKDVDFYIKSVSYDKTRPSEARFPLSFETHSSDAAFNQVMTNVAFTYDASMALIALVAARDFAHAKLIADALVAAQQFDRFYPAPWLRNAYQAGDLFLPPAWHPNHKPRSVRMPGWWFVDPNPTKSEWREDAYQVSTHTGNVAWAILGLLAYYESQSVRANAAELKPYRDAIVALGHWVVDHTRHAKRGFTGGFEGWEPTANDSKPTPLKLEYRATEHNLDLVSAFERLARLDPTFDWQPQADHARSFVESMFDRGERKFWTGTIGNTDDPNKEVIPLDPQAWSIALGSRGEEYWRPAIDYAKKNLRGPDKIGFAFSKTDQSGTWYEGTAQMVVALRMAGDNDGADRVLAVLRAAQWPSGAMLAASRDRLRTGFNAVKKIEWLYYAQPHVGATAWAALAARNINPFVAVRPAER
jgi:hypothetical protein